MEVCLIVCGVRDGAEALQAAAPAGKSVASGYSVQPADGHLSVENTTGVIQLHKPNMYVNLRACAGSYAKCGAVLPGAATCSAASMLLLSPSLLVAAPIETKGSGRDQPARRTNTDVHSDRSSSSSSSQQ